MKRKSFPAVALLLTLSLSMAFSSCISLDLNEEVPQCIEAKIRKLKRKPVQNPPAEVWKWETGGALYYYFTGDCCDQFNELYDAECNYVCAPDGGLGGAGDGKCPVFSQPIKKTLIWRDARN